MTKYKVGYTQGTYDLFHVGHLNLLKNAKKNCDYLIVGINSDKLVHEYKHKNPIIPEQERLQIIEALKIVDEVFICNTLDKLTIWQDHHFDEIFIGTDWQGSPRWNDTEKQLAKIGVKVTYLPYTKHISSSIIRDKIGVENEN